MAKWGNRDENVNELPAYDPTMEMAKKEKRNKFAENAVHAIPLVLIFLPLFYGSFPIHLTHSLLLKVNINDVSRLNYCF